MAYIYYLILSFVFFIFQTVVLVNTPFIEHFFDFFLVIIIYVGLFRPLSEGLPTVIVLGLFIDGISGSPFWVYTTTYIWLLAIIKWLIQYFDARSVILLPFMIIAGILIENMFFAFVSTGMFGGTRITLNGVHIVMTQLMMALIAGPFIIISIRRIHEKILPEVASNEGAGRNKKS